MLSLDHSSDHPAILTRGFRLCFSWTGDRWCHSIDLGSDSEFQRLAISIEGHEESSRMISPILQELQFQQAATDPDVFQALLVGQSGAHHFSAVFTVQETPDTVRLHVEVADRCRLDSIALASTYAVDLAPSEIVEATPSGIIWSLPSRPGRFLSFEPTPPARSDLREGGRRACHVQASAQITPKQHTHCWAYTWLHRETSQESSHP